ncbi:MAG: aldo/keto reductase [Bryobacterales bacterium]|nr:aldo/keto reductase [Bryobacterales bacterium]
MFDNTASRRSFLAAPLALQTAPPASKSPSTHTKVLGRTGLKVTTVGFGTMITSDASVIERAVDLGINYFDTARTYQSGNCERMVGAALKAHRNKLVLSTKTGKEDKDGALQDLETSLKELQTDHVDIWYIHAKSRADQLTEGRLEAQRIAKQRGMIRFSGVSTHAGFSEIIPAAIKSGAIDVILTSYNFTMGATIDPLLADAKKAGLGVVAMKVMAGGFRRVKPGDPLYHTLKKDGVFPAALRWSLRNANIDTAIPSITDHDQLDENLRCMGASFSPSDSVLLAEQRAFVRPLYCQACGDCLGVCPKGLPIPDIMRFVMYADGYGQFAMAREEYLSLPDSARLVRCEDCVTCAVRCPNHVAVASRMRRAQELFA